MKRKIMGMGRYSIGVTLPKELLHALKWRRGQDVEITAKGRSLRVHDARSRS